MRKHTKSIFEVLQERRRAALNKSHQGAELPEALSPGSQEAFPLAPSAPPPAAEKTGAPKSKAALLAEEAGLPYIDLRQNPPQEEAFSRLPEWTIRNFRVLPHSVSPKGQTVVLTARPYDPVAEMEVRRILPESILAVADEDLLEQAIEKALKNYRSNQAVQEISDLLKEENEELKEAEINNSAFIEFVNRLLREAVALRASDLHIEPTPTQGIVRLRIDGELSVYERLEKSVTPTVISRLKLMAGLENQDRRVPMDGQFTLEVSGKKYRFRLSTIPGIHGEGAVVRILPEAGTVPSLEELGFLEDTLLLFRRAIHRPYGLILVTGPTGSGKTTTLFASIKELMGPTRKIITVEDPVEYVLPGLLQVQVAPEVGRTFSRVLRAILRHDPDIIVVGEIRDAETAKIAVEASLTGHLVLASLHTNDAATAPIRLLEMGVEPYLLHSLLAVLSQRLVRKVCPACARPYEPVLPSQYQKAGKWQRGAGCPHCGQTGYHGRIGIHELMLMDEELVELVVKGVEAPHIKAAAVKKGMRTLLEDGLTKAAMGITTVEEVLAKVMEEA